MTRRPSPGPDWGGRETFLRSRWAEQEAHSGANDAKVPWQKDLAMPNRTDSGFNRETATRIWKESEKRVKNRHVSGSNKTEIPGEAEFLFPFWRCAQGAEMGLRFPHSTLAECYGFTHETASKAIQEAFGMGLMLSGKSEPGDVNLGITTIQMYLMTE